LTHEAMHDIAHTTLYNIDQWALQHTSGNELAPELVLKSEEPRDGI
jgi:hypothetical protein